MEKPKNGKRPFLKKIPLLPEQAEQALPAEHGEDSEQVILPRRSLASTDEYTSHTTDQVTVHDSENE
eukprot:180872-Amphidinium_carterae.1